MTKTDGAQVNESSWPQVELALALQRASLAALVCHQLAGRTQHERSKLISASKNDGPQQNDAAHLERAHFGLAPSDKFVARFSVCLPGSVREESNQFV